MRIRYFLSLFFAVVVSLPGQTLAAPDPGGNVTVTQPSGAPVSIAEDSPTPAAANIRLTPTTVSAPEGGPVPDSVRIVSTAGGTFQQSDGTAITSGGGGTILPLDAKNGLNLRFRPEADRDISASFNYVMVDSEGNNSAESTATIPITPINDAPVFTSDAAMSGIEEDAVDPSGELIVNLPEGAFKDAFQEVDTGDAFAGIAISSDASTAAQGVWQYSINNGKDWSNVGSLSSSEALLLDGDTMLRFLPAEDFNGTPGALTVHPVDDSSSLDFTSDVSRQVYDITSAVPSSPVGTAGASLDISVTGMPDITSATYNQASGQLVVEGNDFQSNATGTLADINVSLLAIKNNETTHSLLSGNVDIDSPTRFTVILSGSDVGNIDTLVDAGSFLLLEASAGYMTAETDASASGIEVVVIAEDSTSPVATSVSMRSNNPYDSSLANPGDTVTLDLVTDENVTNVTATIAGQPATVNDAGDADARTWQAQYTMIDEFEEGPVSFAVDFEDLAGNVATQVTAVTSGDVVVFDNTSPTLSSVTMSSDNNDPTRAQVGDTVYLNITASEGLGAPTVTIAGNSADVNDAGDSDARTWQATYELTAADTPGGLSFTVTGISDLAGNLGTDVSAVTSGTPVVFDITPPILTAINPASGAEGVAVNAALTLTFNEKVWPGSGSLTLYHVADDSVVEAIDVTGAAANGWGAETVSLNPAADLAASTGYYVRVDAGAVVDGAGNAFSGIADATYWTFTTSSLSPPTLALTMLEGGELTSNETLNVSGTVSDDDGIEKLTINGEEVAVNPDGSFSTAVTLAEGANEIVVTAWDLLGSQTSETRTVYLDTAAPVLTVTEPADNIVTQDELLSVSGTVTKEPAEGAGPLPFDPVFIVDVLLNEGVSQAAEVEGSNFTLTLTLEPGPNSLTITASDQAGNESASVHRSVTLDLEAPNLAITHPAEDMTLSEDSLLLEGTVSDDATAIVLTVLFRDQEFSPPVSEEGHFSELLTFEEAGTYSVTVTAADESEHVSTVTRTIIYEPFLYDQGDVNGDGRVSAVDALLVMQMAVGLRPVDPDLVRYADVAPLVNGMPSPDGQVNSADALIILKKAVGQINF